MMTPTTTIIRTDEEIKTAIVNELRWDTRIDASKVTAEVNDGIVTLKGTVPTYGSLLAARTDAASVAGVKGVENLLTVALLSSPPVPNDTTILSNAENILDWSSDIDSLNIRVDVNGGVVSLTGTVTTHWEKDRAEDIVSALRGVIAISNELAVVPTADISDEIIAEDIIDALTRNALVDTDKVDVTVSFGVVTLSGTVPTVGASITAYRTASHTTGVVRVQNNLYVQP